MNFFQNLIKSIGQKKKVKKLEKILRYYKKMGGVRRKARIEGTDLHNQIENFYNKISLDTSELEKFMKFHEFIVKNYKPYRTEWRVFDEKLLAGTIDMVYKKSNTSFLFDWKRSKKL